MPTPDEEELQARYDDGHQAKVIRQRRTMIDRERDRRIAHGFEYEGKAIQLDDRSGLALSQMVLKASLSDETFSTEWIATDNSRIPLDKAGALTMGVAAINWMERHVLAARALKDMDPPPADFAENDYW